MVTVMGILTRVYGPSGDKWETHMDQELFGGIGTEGGVGEDCERI